MTSAPKSPSLYLPELATIEKVATMTTTEKYFRIRMNSGKELGHLPGQFVEVSLLGVGEAPISVSSSPTLKGSFELVVRKVGNVTGVMHGMKEGSTLGIRGPFGTNFPFAEARGRDVLFVAGGIGLVPARSFINYVLDNRKDYGRVIILFGARTPADRLFTDELSAWANRKDVEFLETVDRGDPSWKGNVGVITTLFPKIDIDAAKTACVIVGPPIMYKFVIIEAKKKDLADKDIFMSLERRMKCGVGKCGHCQINQYYCCQEGPVFTYEQVKPLPEAL
jgi:NAD(P)H-flavin reductase